MFKYLLAVGLIIAPHTSYSADVLEMYATFSKEIDWPKALSGSVGLNKTVYALDEPIIMNVKMTNSTKGPIIISNRLPIGEAYLRISITRDDGTQVEYQGLLQKQPLVSHDTFLWLPMGYYYGRFCDLANGDCKYDLTRKGKYRLKASYQNNDRDSLLSRIAKGEVQESITKPSVLIWEGTLEFPEITFEIQ